MHLSLVASPEPCTCDNSLRFARQLFLAPVLYTSLHAAQQRGSRRSAEAPQSEQEEAIKKAEAQWQKCDCVASWGCAWYPKWLDRVREAVARGQRLKAVFFPKQVGQGKLSMEELSREKVDLWDNVGCGGSQKCELATLDRLQKQEGSKWDYDEVDVADFLGSEFTAGCPVYAKTKGEGGEEWRRGVLVRQKTRGTIGGRVSWLVRCEKTQETDARQSFSVKPVRSFLIFWNPFPA